MLSLESQNILDVSTMASTLIPSEIIRLNNDIMQKRKEGKIIYNLTIGDFDSKFFPIPKLLENEIINCYKEGHTNYPPAHGELELRTALENVIQTELNVHYTPDNILIAGGSRPLIYALYRTLINPGDGVIYAVPSWNNNHYCHLVGAKKIELEVHADQNFMPTAKDLEPLINDAYLLALCSPQNPTGTAFTKLQLQEICQLVYEENMRRKGNRKPLYILFDQMYWKLTFGNIKHYHPVELIPELQDYTIYIDGLSKAYAGTGVRVGWSFGPNNVLSKMRAILSHIGAWAPKAEQIATGRFLNQTGAIDEFMTIFKPEIELRLRGIYQGIKELQSQSYPIDIIPPQAAIYLTVRFPWKGKKCNDGIVLNSQADVTSYLLNQCKIAVVPFNAFGASANSDWYRISIGTLDKKDIPVIIENLKEGMNKFVQ